MSRDHAEPGSVGLETALAVALTQEIDMTHILRAMSWRPAELLGLGTSKQRTISPGAHADLTIIDPHERFRVSTRTQATAGTNSAFEGVELRGRVRSTIVAGQVVVPDGGGEEEVAKQGPLAKAGKTEAVAPPV